VIEVSVSQGGVWCRFFHRIPSPRHCHPRPAAGGDRTIIVYDVDRVLSVAARAAAGQWVPAVDEEERVLVRIKPPPDNPGEWR
jgi:hypothetical protein